MHTGVVSNGCVSCQQCSCVRVGHSLMRVPPMSLMFPCNVRGKNSDELSLTRDECVEQHTSSSMVVAVAVVAIKGVKNRGTLWSSTLRALYASPLVSM